MKYRLTGSEAGSDEPVNWLVEAASSSQVEQFARSRHVNIEKVELVAARGLGSIGATSSVSTMSQPAAESAGSDSGSSFEMDLSEESATAPTTLVDDEGPEATLPAPATTESAVDAKGRGQKRFAVALILSILFGVCGIDRFYLGYVMLGVLKLITFGGCGIWALIDLILIAVGKMRDADGNALA